MQLKLDIFIYMWTESVRIDPLSLNGGDEKNENESCIRVPQN